MNFKSKLILQNRLVWLDLHPLIHYELILSHL